MSKEAMKLALEALDNLMYWDNGKSDYDQARQAITALETELAKPDFWEGYVPEPVKPAQDALDKKAENARELGLDYEPAQQEFVSPGGGYVPAIPAQQRPIKTFHGGKAWPVQKPAQQQEPVTRRIDMTELQELKLAYAECSRQRNELLNKLKSQTQRTWQGLTDEKTEHLWEISRAAMPRYHTFKTLIEKALRERNT